MRATAVVTTLVMKVVLAEVSHLVRASAFVAPSVAKGRRSSSSSSSSFSSLFLVPTENPELTEEDASLSGVSYADVLRGLDELFPPAELGSRNAVSRTDGYWPFVKDAEEPPPDLTYGEWDLTFFARLVDRAREHFVDDDDDDATWANRVFCDVGSGAGRLVLAAAALHPWRRCRGVEILPGLHDAATAAVDQCRAVLPGGADLPLAPIELTNASVGDDDAAAALRDVDLVFVASTCMGPELMRTIAEAVGDNCRPGTVVVTTDHELPTTPSSSSSSSWRLEQVDSVDGYCWIVGGLSTAYLYRVATPP